MKILQKPDPIKIYCSCGCIYECDNKDDFEILSVEVEGQILNKEYYSARPFCGRKIPVDIPEIVIRRVK